MNESTHDNAGIPFPPPSVFAAGLIIGVGVNAFVPMRFVKGALSYYIGVPIMIVGLVVAGLAVMAMLRAGTSPDPDQPTQTLLTSGPFALTRNPIYVSFTVIYLGLAIVFNSLLALALLPVAVIVIDRFVIAREEKYLARKFGDAYADYKKRARRWL